jgi:hypothetical protein
VPLQGARGALQLWVLDVPHCNDFRFFRLCGLNVHRLLVLRHLFHLHFFLHRVQGDRNKPDGHCALVYPILSEQDDLV